MYLGHTYIYCLFSCIWHRWSNLLKCMRIYQYDFTRSSSASIIWQGTSYNYRNLFFHIYVWRIIYLVSFWTHLSRLCIIGIQNTLILVYSYFLTIRFTEWSIKHIVCGKQYIAVWEAPESCCQSGDQQILEADKGYLSSTVTLNTGCGSTACPWQINAPNGQNLDVFIWDFNQRELAFVQSCFKRCLQIYM